MPIILKGTAKTLRNFDVCECGDYRYQHEYKSPHRCMLNPHPGIPAYDSLAWCAHFVLFFRAKRVPEGLRKLLINPAFL